MKNLKTLLVILISTFYSIIYAQEKKSITRSICNI